MGEQGRRSPKEHVKAALDRLGLLSSTQRANHLFLRFLHSWLPEHLPDLALHMDTAGWVRTTALGLDPARSHVYGPSPWTALAAMLAPEDISPQDTFVDFGCGKGRVVYLAARYPFGRVLGVEISAQLTAIARRNLARNRRRLRCKNVEIVTADVLDFAIPDDMTVAYFFSPVTRIVFEGVLDHIVASIERRPRSVRLIYLAPEEHELVLERGFRELKRVHYHYLCYGRLYIFEPAAHQDAAQ